MKKILGKLAIKVHFATASFIGKQSLFRLIQRVIGPTLQMTKEGLLLETRLTSSMDLSYLHEGGHSLIRNEIAKLKEGQCFLDIGANVGYFSLLASKIVGTSGLVFAVEPSRRELGMMMNNIYHNSVSNIVVTSLAAAQKNSLLKLSIEPEHTGLNKISKVTSESHIQLTLSARMEQMIPLTVLPINLAKIDTEGYELFTLLGMQNLLEKQSILKIIIEISPEFLAEHDQTYEDIYALLKGYGYLPSELTIKDGKQWDEVFSLAK